MKNNLIIGNTSQSSYYFPKDYIRISSRNIDFNYLKNNKWGSVYVTLSEQRFYMDNIDYITPNFHYTLDIIYNLINNSDKIAIYSSCELWNKCKGIINLNDKFSNDYPNDYALSKEMLVNKIFELRKKDKKYNKVIIIHPFYFNSVHRQKNFLFGKIFDSIINEKKIETGDTYFYRDMVHTKYMVERSINAISDEIIGSGRLFFINDFIRDLYSFFDMDYDFYVKEKKIESIHSEKLYYSYQKNIYTYERLFKDTIDDIKKYKNYVR